MSRRAPTPVEDLELIESFSTSDAVANARLTIDWEGVDPQVGGLPKMLRGLLLMMTVTVDTVAATMPGAMQGERVADVLETVQLGFDGHNLIHNLSGLRLYHDSLRLFGAPPLAIPSDVPDADASAVSRTFPLYIPFTHPRAKPEAARDGAIAMAAFRKRDLILKITGSDFGAFPGVTLDTCSIDVYADWYAGDRLTVPTEWQIRHIEDKRTQFSVDPGPGFLYYADIFDDWEDNASSYDFDHSDYADIQLRLGNGRVEDWSSPSVPARRHNLKARRLDLGAFALTDGAEEFIPLVGELRDEYATKRPSGPFSLRFGTRSNHAETNVQYRTRGVRSEPWLAVMFKRLGMDPAGEQFGSYPQAAGHKSIPDWLRRHMDIEVAWAGMPYPGVRRQRSRRFPKTFGL